MKQFFGLGLSIMWLDTVHKLFWGTYIVTCKVLGSLKSCKLKVK